MWIYIYNLVAFNIWMKYTLLFFHDFDYSNFRYFKNFWNLSCQCMIDYTYWLQEGYLKKLNWVNG